jgi:heme/copper-type cytochrome/quinol oxidase subunit 4
MIPIINVAILYVAGILGMFALACFLEWYDTRDGGELIMAGIFGVISALVSIAGACWQ